MLDNKFVFVVALLGCVTVAGWLLEKTGVMKPKAEINPGWAYFRWRLIMLGIIGLASGFVVLFDRLAA